MSDELRIGWGGKFLQAKGNLVVTILLLVGAVGFLEYQATTRGTAVQQQHNRIADAVDLQTCITSIPPEDRVKLRNDLVRSSNPRETLRIGWCPWLEKLNHQ